MHPTQTQSHAPSGYDPNQDYHTLAIRDPGDAAGGEAAAWRARADAADAVRAGAGLKASGAGGGAETSGAGEANGGAETSEGGGGSEAGDPEADTRGGAGAGGDGRALNTLPPLDDGEAAALSTFLSSGGVAAAALAMGVMPVDLARFLSQPHIRAYMAFIDTLDVRRDLREGLDTLRKILTLNNPIEARRAASTIVRYHGARSAPAKPRRDEDGPDDGTSPRGTKARRHKGTEGEDREAGDAAPGRAASSHSSTRALEHSSTSAEGTKGHRDEGTKCKGKNAAPAAPPLTLSLCPFVPLSLAAPLPRTAPHTSPAAPPHRTGGIPTPAPSPPSPPAALAA